MSTVTFIRKRVVFFSIIVFVFAATFYQAIAAEKQTLRLCYFSLNNEKEFIATKNFIEKYININSSNINPQSESPLNINSITINSLNTNTSNKNLPHDNLNKKVLVKEYHDYAEYARNAFVKMAAGDTCDGLVLSGHHRGEGFEGERSIGLLSLDTMEKLSCHSAVHSWFKNVKAVWLQGCNTDDAVTERYRKLFPNAVQFTWQGKAPSQEAHLTIPEHFKNIMGETNNKSNLFHLLEGQFDLQDIGSITRKMDLQVSPTQSVTGKLELQNNKASSIGKFTYSLLAAKKAWQKVATTTAVTFPWQYEFSVASLQKNQSLACELAQSEGPSARLLEEIFLSSTNIKYQVERILEILQNASQSYDDSSYNQLLAYIERQFFLKSAEFKKDILQEEKLRTKVQLYKLYVWARELRNSEIETTIKKDLRVVFSRRYQNGVDARLRQEEFAILLLEPIRKDIVLLDKAFIAQIKSNQALGVIMNSMLRTKTSHARYLLSAIKENRFAKPSIISKASWQMKILK